MYANKSTVQEIEEHLDGNLCRCTGYRPIWDAARSLCDNAAEVVKGPCGIPCNECPEHDTCEQDCSVDDENKKELLQESKLSLPPEGCCSSSSKDKMVLKDELIPESKKDSWMHQPMELFPRELLDSSSSIAIELSKPLMVIDRSSSASSGEGTYNKGGSSSNTSSNNTGGTWFKPTTLIGLLELLKNYSNNNGYKIVVGNTEVGIGK